MQAQQVQLKELIWVWAQEADARIAALTRQQDLNEKIQAQQAAVLGASEKFRIPKMTIKDNVEAYLEAFE